MHFGFKKVRGAKMIVRVGPPRAPGRLQTHWGVNNGRRGEGYLPLPSLGLIIIAARQIPAPIVKA